MVTGCRWKDRDGFPLAAGAVVMLEAERNGTLYLGRVVRNGRSGQYRVRKEAYFDRETMQFERMPCGGVDEGREVALAPWKRKSWWRRRDYCVPNVRLIRPAQERAQRPGIDFDAPAPAGW